jgi:disease resistance protein RPM1
MQVRQLVGIHKLKAELISRILSSSSQRLEIFSIRGAGGMGKTTLAKAGYENIRGDFHCSAFVSVGRQADVKKALRDILIDLGKKTYSDLNMTMLNEGELIDELHHFLENKRYAC